MGTITLPNFRVSGTDRARVRLKDGGVYVEWSRMTEIKAWLYSVEQKTISGRFDVQVDPQDGTRLQCVYSAQKPQYPGVNKLILQCKYEGAEKAYDKPLWNFVRWTADQAGEEITMEDPEVDVEIVAEDMSSSVLDEATAAALAAADRADASSERAEAAAQAAEHMVDIHTGPAGKSAYEVAVDEGYTGTEEEWLASLKGPVGETPDISIGTVTTVEPGEPAAASMTGTPEAPVLNLSIPKGVVGSTPNISIGTVTTGAPGTPVAITITGTAEAPVLNITIPQGMKGDTGVSADYPITIYNGLDSDATDAALAAAQGKVLDGKISQLQQEVTAELSQLEAKVDGEYIVQELPTSSWKTETLGTNWGSNNDKIYFDTRNIIDAGHRISKFSICKNTNNGTMRVYFIKASDCTIVTYKEVTLTGGAGVVSFDMTLEDVYYEAGPMYVGIYSTFTWRSQSGITDITTSRELVISTGVVSNVKGRLWGYGITVISQVSPGLIEEVEALKAQMGTEEDVILPNADWIEGSFPTGGGGGDANWVIYDSRCKVSAIRKLKKVYADIRYGGTMRVYLLSLSGQVVAYKDVITSQGWNEIPITFDDAYYTQEMFVGICTGSGVYIYMRSNSAANTSFRRVLDTQETVSMSYDVGYGIMVEDLSGLISVRVDAISVSPSETLADILAKGQNDIVLGPYDYTVNAPIVLISGMTIRGSFGKTRLILTDGCQTAITASNADGIKISDLEIVGTCPDYAVEMNGIVAGTGYDLVETEADAIALNYMGTEKGIYLYYCENVVLENLRINHIDGSAIRVNHTGMNYTRGLNACNLFITNCYNGIYCENEHEFSQYTNWTVTSCMIGVYVAAGNLIFTAGHATRCRFAMMFVAGTNHAHGVVNGIEIKHNQVAGIFCNGVVYGEFFEGIYLSYSPLVIRDSTEVYFDDIMVGNMSIDVTGTTGVNKIGKLVKRNNGISMVNTDTLTILETVQLY